MLYDDYLTHNDEKLTWKFAAISDETLEELSYEEFCLNEYASYINDYLVKLWEEFNSRRVNPSRLALGNVCRKSVSSETDEIPF